jgi:asparagine synthase (glutamine-hydrolysing)
MNIKPSIPQGGFLCARNSGVNIEELNRSLLDRGAETIVYKRNDLLFANFREFHGQGIWSGSNGAVVYDVDLTNELELRRLVNLEGEGFHHVGELLWILYQRFGLDFLDLLRGPFGFAIWDDAERKLIVVTDPYGIRPVVYSQPARGLVVGSRNRHLLLHSAVSKERNPEAIYHYLFFSAIPSPVSIYKDIRKLEPGKGLILDSESLKEFTHYDINYRPDNSAKKKHWVKTIPRRVERAVANFVPLSEHEKTGCFLSGGTDSSSVAGYYTKLSGRSAKTFSVGFEEPGYNELHYAHIASGHFGTEQYDNYVKPKEVLALIEYLPKIYDEPFGNSSVVPTYYCAKFAREVGVAVLLAGDGGDEIFGGNERYVTNLLFERYHKLPSTARKILLEPTANWLPSVGPVYKAKRYIRRANILNPERFFSYNLLATINPREVFRKEYLANVDTGCFLKIAKAHYDQLGNAHVTDRLLYLDMKFTITDNDLRKVTQMCESAGIQVRYPLLDRELVDFAATIPPTLKVKPGRNRYIFKRAMTNFLPREIIAKTKHGFGLPIAPWFKKNAGLSALLHDTLFASQPRITEWILPEFLQTMKRNFQVDTTSYWGSYCWVFLMLELWMREQGS